jgi:hypothetical protein
MNSTTRTLVHAGIALALAALAFLSSPALPKSAVFEDQNQPFYPSFTDPLAAASLEVSDYDDAMTRVRRFKVILQDGKYVIPSKWNHPADAKERLAKTAASMIGLRKDDVRSDQPKDHELYGVVDPTDAAEGTAGRGARVTLRDAAGRVLSDLIFGKAVREKEGTRYVRLPGHKRVYESRVPYEVSAKFSDWVETDLLQVSASQIRKLETNSYTVDEEAQLVKDLDIHILSKDAQGAWNLEALGKGEELRKETVDEMVGALDELRIVDVRRKPEALAKAFRSEQTKLTSRELGDLRDRGRAPGAHRRRGEMPVVVRRDRVGRGRGEGGGQGEPVPPDPDELQRGRVPRRARAEGDESGRHAEVGGGKGEGPAGVRREETGARLEGRGGEEAGAVARAPFRGLVLRHLGRQFQEAAQDES